MPNSTRTPSRHRARRRRALAAVGVALATVGVALGAALTVTGPALADGDPASDVLASQPVFVPGDAGVTAARQRQLTQLVARAGHAGYPIRVAIVAGPADLGSVTELWRMPGPYARFLGQELSLVFRGTLVVLMPQGFGVVRVSGAGAAPGPSAVLSSGPVHGSLATAAEVAVLSLTRTAGYRIRLPPAAVTPAPGSWLQTVDAGSWAALAAGAALIALAWAASLRARPLSLRRPTS